MNEKFIQPGLKATNSDFCVYIKKDDDLIIPAIYVEDIKQLLTKLAKSFQMKDLIPLNFYLGTEFKQDIKTETATMSQTKYMNNISNCLEVENWKVVKTQLDKSIKQSAQMSPKTEGEQQEVESIPHQDLYVFVSIFRA